MSTTATTTAPLSAHRDTSISGVLIAYIIPDNPAWAPHRTVTNDDALRAIIAHMQRDGLRPDLMEDRNGPVDMSTGSAFGNFFLCSGGFHVYGLTPAQCEQLRSAWETHKQSRQYRIAVELCAIGDTIKKEAQQLERPRYGHDTREHTIYLRYRDRIKTLESEANAILRTGVQS